MVTKDSIWLMITAFSLCIFEFTSLFAYTFLLDVYIRKPLLFIVIQNISLLFLVIGSLYFLQKKVKEKMAKRKTVFHGIFDTLGLAEKAGDVFTSSWKGPGLKADFKQQKDLKWKVTLSAKETELMAAGIKVETDG